LQFLYIDEQTHNIPIESYYSVRHSPSGSIPAAVPVAPVKLPTAPSDNPVVTPDAASTPPKAPDTALFVVPVTFPTFPVGGLGWLFAVGLDWVWTGVFLAAGLEPCCSTRTSRWKGLTGDLLVCVGFLAAVDDCAWAALTGLVAGDDTGLGLDTEAVCFDDALLGPSFGGAFLTGPVEAVTLGLLVVDDTGFFDGAVAVDGFVAGIVATGFVTGFVTLVQVFVRGVDCTAGVFFEDGVWADDGFFASWDTFDTPASKIVQPCRQNSGGSAYLARLPVGFSIGPETTLLW
jgi:hypothetical protein